MSTTTKQRILRATEHRWHYEYYASGNTYSGGGSYPIYSHQVTTSEGHPWPRDRGVRDVGGPFDTLKLEYLNAHEGKQFGGSYNQSIFPGVLNGTSFPGIISVADRSGLLKPFMVESPTSVDMLSWVPASSDTLTVPGTKFISETIPTNPMLDASVSLAELYREGLPALIGAGILKSRAGFFRELGGEYLNYQFGWLPLVSDLKKASKAIMDQELILKQLERDSGRDVHRKRILPAETVNTTVSYGSDNIHGMPSAAVSGTPWLRRTDHRIRQQWFSGCYTFYFEPSKMAEVERIATQARLVYGLELTPEVLWNLAPWSWLIDWVTNIGAVLSNVSAFQQDGLVLRYGYVMEQNSRTYTRISHQGFKNTTRVDYPNVSSDVFSGIRKMRRRATPFGFGLLESSFSTRQWAILAALGLTRAPK